MEKTSTHAWTFENSSCCATWLVLSWLIPCWGLCLPSLAVATGFRQLVLALTVTTKNNPTHFLCLPTESYPSTSSSLVALDMWGHVLVGARPPIYVETYLCFLLLWVYLSLDHFFHPVDCEAVGMLGAIPAKGQARGRNERCQLGWTGLGWFKVSMKLWPHCVSAWSISMFEAKYLVSIYQQRYFIQLSKWVRCV